MKGQNRWFRATFEATGESCEVMAVYQLGVNGKPVSDPRLVLGDGQPLRRVARGRYQTRTGVVVVSTEQDAP